jgi:hypothetical protein
MAAPTMGVVVLTRGALTRVAEISADYALASDVTSVRSLGLAGLLNSYRLRSSIGTLDNR